MLSVVGFTLLQVFFAVTFATLRIGLMMKKKCNIKMKVTGLSIYKNGTSNPWFYVPPSFMMPVFLLLPPTITYHLTWDMN
jgi:hypothetical protein